MVACLLFICLLSQLVLSLELYSPQSVVLGSDPHVVADWNWKDCGGPEHAIHITSLQITPDPPIPGKNLTVQAKGHVSRLIEDGANAAVIVKLGRIKVLQRNFDVCDAAANANATVLCPVEEGDYDITETAELPSLIPRSEYTVSVRGYTADDNDMVCMDIIVNFK